MKMKWGQWRVSEGPVSLISDGDKNDNNSYLKKKDDVK